jgi:putative DNA primase/helicase
MLANIFPDPEVQLYYKRVMASALCGNRQFEQVYMHTGSGGNGKGLLSDLIERVFGGYYSVMSSGLLTIASKSRNEASPELANKKGKRIAFTTEIEEGSTLQMAAIKQWSGGDKISTRQLYKTAIEFVPQFGLHMCFNDKQPDLKSVDNAIKRRLRMFHYPISFVDNPILSHEKKGDPHLKGKIKEESELWNAVISDLFVVWKDIKNLDFIPVPTECQKHINKYLSENDTIKTWFDENVEKRDGSKIKARDLFNEYINGLEQILKN